MTAVVMVVCTHALHTGHIQLESERRGEVGRGRETETIRSMRKDPALRGRGDASRNGPAAWGGGLGGSGEAN